MCIRDSNTDEGICGYGEAGISVGTGENGVAYMLKDLSQLVLGKDPMNLSLIHICRSY